MLFKILKAALHVALVVLAITAIMAVMTVNRVVGELPAQITAEMDKTRGSIERSVDRATLSTSNAITAQGNLARQAAIKETEETRRALVDEVDGAAILLDRRIRDGLVVLNHHAEEFEARYDDTNLILFGGIKPLHDIGEQVSKAAPDFLDCSGGNVNCLFDRYVPTSRGIEQGSLALGKALPEITAQATAIEKHAAHLAAAADRFTANAEGHPPWWERLLLKLFPRPPLK